METIELVFDTAFLNRKIWEAQLKLVFPIIENFRSIVIDKYRADIERCLPIVNSHDEDVCEAIPFPIPRVAKIP